MVCSVHGAKKGPSLPSDLSPLVILPPPCPASPPQSYANSYESGDRSPESATFIPAEYSPSGAPLLIGAYEFSSTLVVFEITFE